jgi:hypothetical protein
MTGHGYTVEFRIYGDELSPPKISEKLGLMPVHSYSKGEKFANKIREEGLWAFSGDASYEYESLEDGLESVLSILWDKKELVKEIGKCGMRLVWWCGHFQSAFDGGPTLSPSLMSRLGEFGAELFLDCYFSEEDSPSLP